LVPEEEPRTLNEWNEFNKTPNGLKYHRLRNQARAKAYSVVWELLKNYLQEEAMRKSDAKDF
jgi:hypothetical protein